MKRWSRGARPAGLLMGLLCAGTLAVCGALLLGGRNGATLEVRVSGNELVNANGQQIVLHGVDRSGGEFACVQDLGIWTGPMNEASVTAIKKWKVDAVRVPLNEACWNGLSYAPAKYRGNRYRNAIKTYVQLLNRNGLLAILDLHWTQGVYTGPTSHCASTEAVCQKPMPDATQAIPFWRSVALTFRGDDAVIFDLFNEPYPELAVGSSEAAGWRCWLRGGGTCIGISYKVAGMQALVNAVRSVGANNVIMLGGLAYANDLSQWLKYEPTDPDHNLAASWHSYDWNGCSNRSCWDSQIAPVIAKVPVIAGEIGERWCADTYIDRLMKWLDARSTSYLAWAWNTGFTCSGRGLIKSYDGEPTAYGGGYRSHLRSLNNGRARVPVSG